VKSRNTDDRSLISRMLDGDERAFDTFVDELYPRLYRFAVSRLGGDPEAAQDVVQATFAKVIPKLSYYRGEAALFSWLCSFCRYEIAAYWRQQGKQRPEVALREESPELCAALESLAATEDGVESQTQRRELSRLVWATLDFLPRRYGNALRFKYIDGLPVREVGKRLDLSAKAAESLLTRARRAFRDEFTALVGG
jgi:RNA polymerase sigma-70 factor (ECF subfamily)